jgi:hypothetical protein
MSNTWDTVFEEGFSSVPVCFFFAIFNLSFLLSFTRSVCFKCCCINIVVYMYLQWPQLVNLLCCTWSPLILDLFHLFAENQRYHRHFFNKRYFASLTCVFYFAILFQLEPSSFAFRTFSAKRKSQRRALSASMTITTTFVSVCAGSNIWPKEVM